MNWSLRPEGGTRREWVRFYVGWGVAHLLFPLADLGEWADRRAARCIDWAERA